MKKKIFASRLRKPAVGGTRRSAKLRQVKYGRTTPAPETAKSAKMKKSKTGHKIR